MLVVVTNHDHANSVEQDGLHVNKQISNLISDLKHDTSVVNAYKRNNFRSSRHDLGHYQHKHSHCQEVGDHQCDAFTRVRGEEERQQRQS